jgi:hypothetical protein
MIPLVIDQKIPGQIPALGELFGDHELIKHGSFINWSTIH